MSPRPQSRTIPIAQILGLEDVVRVQDPSIQVTDGEDPRWYIRPFVDALDGHGRLVRRQQRIYLGRVAEMKKREAISRKNEIMATINRSQYVVQAQMRFGDFLAHYQREYVLKPENLSASTQGKYLSHLKNHIRPAFASLAMAEITTARIDAWLGEKAKAGLSWATRTDLRNLMCGMFTQARKWGLWKEQNPAMDARVGRKRAVRDMRKLTIEQTRLLLDSLPDDVRLICETALYCTLRISEVLGLQWKHIDLARGAILVRQRYYRGDLDTVKSDRASRDVPMGELSVDLAAIHPGAGHEDDFVFSVRTHIGRYKTPGLCRDDRDINQHFLRPAAVVLGVYHEGFGFHAFRREAVTEHGNRLQPHQLQRLAGHSKADMSLHYTLADAQAQEASVRALQARVRGKVIPMEKGA